MPELLSVSLGLLVGSLIGSFVARWLYEHYFRWRIERCTLLAHEVELLSMRTRLAQQLRALGEVRR
jgi:hypothetical protein